MDRITGRETLSAQSGSSRQVNRLSIQCERGELYAEDGVAAAQQKIG